MRSCLTEEIKTATKPKTNLMLYVEILSDVTSHPSILHPDKPDHLGSLRDGSGGAGVADPEVAGDIHGVSLL